MLFRNLSRNSKNLASCLNLSTMRAFSTAETVCYYSVLGVARTATDYEIKEAFKAQVAAYHPSLTKDTVLNQQEATKKFTLINEAYTVLSDLNCRVIYD